MIVDFYQLAASPLERVLPAVIEKVLASGGRLLVVGEGELLARLDEQLWTYRRDSFLPHGRDRPESQPVLLTGTPEPLNGATHIALVDGRWRDEALTFARAFYFFDAGSLDEPRGAWRALAGRAETECRYWKQQDGKWVEGP
jgi:DNA polymerase-3 subunit chi